MEWIGVCEYIRVWVMININAEAENFKFVILTGLVITVLRVWNRGD